MDRGEGKVTVTVIQPNIETYQEKYNWGKHAGQFHSMAQLTEKSGNGDWIIWPETSVPGTFPVRFPAGFDRKSISIWQLDSLENLSLRLKNKNLLVGASCYGVFLDSHSTNANRVETYNAFLWFRNGSLKGIYQKSKMVAGVEKIPFIDVFPGLKSLALDFGGTTESLRGQDTLSVFFDGTSSVCPLICFEQDFGRHASKGNSGNFLGIGTNDGWWNNSNGHRQHFEFARLRAIENRKWVARAANTGISGFIDPEGNVIGNSLNWDEKGAITQEISLQKTSTLYALWGDVLVVALGLVLLGFQFRKPPKH
jgi:apolipoprotein N-acyltransferase